MPAAAHTMQHAPASSLYIGLMSGTSTDGVDAVLADLRRPHAPHLVSSLSLPMLDPLRQELLALNTPGADELRRAALAANALADLYSVAVHEVLTQAALSPASVNAIGAHGQTVRHDPDAGYSWQLNAPARLAEATGITVIADFRTRDIAAGGQGAPLVPAFHAAVFRSSEPRAVLNLGGIANLTVLRPNTDPQGFDTGPANMLLDAWHQTHRGQTFDAGGQWAASGTCNPALLHYLLDSEPWFHQTPPKSTGRDRFNLAWLQQRLQSAPVDTKNLPLQDIQATLQSLTIHSIGHALHCWAPDVHDVVACGGGVRNTYLMRELAARLPVPLKPSSQLGIPEHLVEALAFAWLAWAHCNRIPAGLPAVTGARHTTVLGCCYP